MSPARYAAIVGYAVVPVADLVNVAPGCEDGAGGDADGAIGVGVGVAGAAGGELVEVWRLHKRVPGAAHGGGLVLVGEDEEQVGWFQMRVLCGRRLFIVCAMLAHIASGMASGW